MAERRGRLVRAAGTPPRPLPLQEMTTQRLLAAAHGRRNAQSRCQRGGRTRCDRRACVAPGGPLVVRPALVAVAPYATSRSISISILCVSGPKASVHTIKCTALSSGKEKGKKGSCVVAHVSATATATTENSGNKARAATPVAYTVLRFPNLFPCRSVPVHSVEGMSRLTDQRAVRQSAPARAADCDRCAAHQPSRRGGLLRLGETRVF